MHKPKEKLKSGLSLGKLKGKILRLLKADVEFQTPSIDQERSAHVPTPVGIYRGHQREIRSSLLNAECNKAEALTELQRRRFIC